MQLINEQVEHPTFGVGTICSVQLSIVSVDFAEYGVKKFLYPEAFARHIKACRPELQAQLQIVADDKQAQQQEDDNQQELIALAHKRLLTEEALARYQKKKHRKRG